MPRGFNIARLPAGTPNIINYKYDSAETFKAGALVVDAADGEITECGADPASVLGVALEAVSSKPGGTGIPFNPSYITGGTRTEVAVAVADRTTVFSCRGKNGATDPTTPAVTDIGEQFGVVKVSDDWVLDISDTVNVVCEVVDIDIDNKIYFVKFLEARLALP